MHPLSPTFVYVLLLTQRAYNRRCGSCALHRLNEIVWLLNSFDLRLISLNRWIKGDLSTCEYTLIHNSRFLKKILLNLCTFNCATSVEKDINVFSKSGWIVISNRFCVSKCYYNKRTILYFELKKYWRDMDLENQLIFFSINSYVTF